MSDTSYRDYGYSDAEQTWSHGYLWDVVSTLLPQPSQCPQGIIDLGCGNGAIALRLLGLGYDVKGVDASVSGIAIANQKRPGSFYVMDFSMGRLPPPLAGKRFDIVLSTEVIEHLYDPKSMLKIARSILQPGGMLIITTPYHGYLKNLALAAAGKMDGHFTALWDGGHIKFFSRRTLTALLRQEGFDVTDFRGAGRLPYLWKSMVLAAKLR
jgi:2-polyprenyl-6-hydroxyphenyl methylase/3-demethylubiquinone-9 3-methyltransferase